MSVYDSLHVLRFMCNFAFFEVHTGSPQFANVVGRAWIVPFHQRDHLVRHAAVQWVENVLRRGFVPGQLVGDTELQWTEPREASGTTLSSNDRRMAS